MRSDLVIISMAWMAREEGRVFSRMPNKPDMDSLTYWISRFEPIIKSESNQETIVVFANRTGVENDSIYAGSSAVVGIKNGEVNIYGILGRGDKELLIVDTGEKPQAKMIYRPGVGNDTEDTASSPSVPRSSTSSSSEKSPMSVGTSPGTSPIFSTKLSPKQIEPIPDDLFSPRQPFPRQSSPTITYPPLVKLNSSAVGPNSGATVPLAYLPPTTERTRSKERPKLARLEVPANNAPYHIIEPRSSERVFKATREFKSVSALPIQSGVYTPDSAHSQSGEDSMQPRLISSPRHRDITTQSNALFTPATPSLEIPPLVPLRHQGKLNETRVHGSQIEVRKSISPTDRVNYTGRQAHLSLGETSQPERGRGRTLSKLPTKVPAKQSVSSKLITPPESSGMGHRQKGAMRSSTTPSRSPKRRNFSGNGVEDIMNTSASHKPETPIKSKVKDQRTMRQRSSSGNRSKSKVDYSDSTGNGCSSSPRIRSLSLPHPKESAEVLGNRYSSRPHINDGLRHFKELGKLGKLDKIEIPKQNQDVNANKSSEMVTILASPSIFSEDSPSRDSTPITPASKNQSNMQGGGRISHAYRTCHSRSNSEPTIEFNRPKSRASSHSQRAELPHLRDSLNLPTERPRDSSRGRTQGTKWSLLDEPESYYLQNHEENAPRKRSVSADTGDRAKVRFSEIVEVRRAASLTRTLADGTIQRQSATQNGKTSSVDGSDGKEINIFMNPNSIIHTVTLEPPEIANGGDSQIVVSSKGAITKIGLQRSSVFLFTDDNAEHGYFSNTRQIKADPLIPTSMSRKRQAVLYPGPTEQRDVSSTASNISRRTISGEEIMGSNISLDSFGHNVVELGISPLQHEQHHQSPLSQLSSSSRKERKRRLFKSMPTGKSISRSKSAVW
jgi:hypothetical protein